MYKELEDAYETLNGLTNTPLTEEKSQKIHQIFATTAHNIDQVAGRSQNMEDSMRIKKLHEGMLACGRLIQRIREEARQKNI